MNQALELAGHTDLSVRGLHLTWRLAAGDGTFQQLAHDAAALVLVAEEAQASLELVIMRFPMILAQIALRLGRPGLENTAEELLFSPTMNDWMTGPVAARIEAAQAFYRFVSSGQPALFLEWQSSHPQGLPRFETHLWRATAAAEAAAQVEDAAQATPFRQQAFEEIVQMLTDNPSDDPEAYVINYTAEEMAMMPRAREACLAVIDEALGRFNPADWDKREPALRRLVLFVAAVEGPAALASFDRMVVPSNVPGRIRELLNGLIRRYETGLDVEGWKERILQTMEQGEQGLPRAEAMLGKAKLALGAAACAPIELGMALKRAEHEERVREGERQARIGQIIQAARTAYQSLDFQRARQLLNTIDIADRSWSAWRDLDRRIAALQTVWDLYLRADPDGDARARAEAERLAALETGPQADRTPNQFLEYMNRVQDLERDFLERRIGPLEAIQRADTFNHIGQDLRLDKLRGTASENIRAAEGHFARARDLFAVFTRSLSALHQEPASQAVEAVESAWGEALEMFSQALELYGDSEAFPFFLIQQAQTYINSGRSDLQNQRLGPANARFDLAQDLAWVVDRNSLKENWTREARQVRSQARPLEVFKSLWMHEMTLSAKIQADLHQKFQSDPEEGELYFEHSPDGWQIEEGRLYIPAVWPMVPQQSAGLPRSDRRDRRPGRDRQPPAAPSLIKGKVWKGDEVDQKMVKPAAGTSSSYQITWDIPGSPTPLRIGVSYLGKSRDGRGLEFEVDKKTAEMLEGRKSQLNNGRLCWVEDAEAMAHLSVLRPLVERLRAEIAQPEVLNNRRRVTLGSERWEMMAERLLGLNIDTPPVTETPVEFRNEKLGGDEHQRRTIQTLLSLKTFLALVWGPPGSGKTTSLEEICYQMTQRGEIVVVVSQSNYGLDNVGKKLLPVEAAEEELRRDGIPFVRAAAKGEKVDEELKTGHKNRLDILMNLINEHYDSPGKKGFVYLATNNGMAFDRQLFALLKMYLDGEPISRIRSQYQYMRYKTRPVYRTNATKEDATRASIQPVLAQEEGSLADVAETLLPIYQLNPKEFFMIGDHKQLPPFGADSDDVEKVKAEARTPHFEFSLERVRQIFSEEALRVRKRSLFEWAYLYAERWGGIPLFILRTARRGPPAITRVFNELFYEHQLISRVRPGDELLKDTWMVVDRDRDERGRERRARREQSYHSSWRNFTEAGDVVRLVAYNLNRGMKPEDIMILSPYSAQNELIQELLWAVAVMNDTAARQTVSPEEMNRALDIIQKHTLERWLNLDRMDPDAIAQELRVDRSVALQILDALGVFTEGARGRPISGDRRAQALRLVEPFISRRTSSFDARAIFRALENLRTPTVNMENNVQALYSVLTPLYTVRFRGSRQISRNDIKEPPVAQDPDRSQPPPSNPEDIRRIAPSTIDSIQGREKPVVIISFVRSNMNNKIGFLKRLEGLRRLNVAISRSQIRVALVGSFSTLINGSRDRHGDSVYERMIGIIRTLYFENDRQSPPIPLNWKILHEAPDSLAAYGTSAPLTLPSTGTEAMGAVRPTPEDSAEVSAAGGTCRRTASAIRPATPPRSWMACA